MTPPRKAGVAALLLALATASAIWSLVGSEWLYPHGSADNDEAVYLFQAEMLTRGALTVPATQAEFHRPWMSGRRRDRLVMVFPPTWPATLALGMVGGIGAAGVVALVSAAMVPAAYGFALGLLRSARVALLCAAAVAASPFVLIHATTRLGYLFPLLLELTAGAALLAAARADPGRCRVGLMVGAGLLLGVLVTARPLDGVLWAMCLASWWLMTQPRQPRQLAAVLGWLAVGASVPVALLLAYNRAITGNPLTFSLQAAGGNNSFGFGERYLAEGMPVVDVTVRMALGALRRNVLELPHWVAGGLVAMVAVCWGVWCLARRMGRWAGSEVAVGAALVWSAAVVVLFPLAYFFYWGNLFVVNGRAVLGPHYYVPLVVPVALLTAVALDDLWRRRAAYVGVAVAVMALVTLVGEMPAKVDAAHQVSRGAGEDVAAVAAAVGDGPALVVIPATEDGAWILHPRGWYANRPDLSGPVLYGVDRGNDTLRLLADHPDRQPFRFFLRAPDPADPRRMAVSVEPIQVVSGPSVELQTVITPPAGATEVVAVASDGREGWQCTLPADATRGTLDVSWVLDASGLSTGAQCIGGLQSAPPGPTPQLSVGARFDGADGADVRYWWDSDPATATVAVAEPGEELVLVDGVSLPAETDGMLTVAVAE